MIRDPFATIKDVSPGIAYARICGSLFSFRQIFVNTVVVDGIQISFGGGFQNIGGAAAAVVTFSVNQNGNTGFSESIFVRGNRL